MRVVSLNILVYWLLGTAYLFCCVSLELVAQISALLARVNTSQIDSEFHYNNIVHDNNYYYSHKLVSLTTTVLSSVFLPLQTSRSIPIVLMQC